jgi:large subunit ribosomal protein L15e
MSFTKLLRETFKEEYKNGSPLLKERILERRRKKEAIFLLERPTNLARARSLGYKAKEGIYVVSVRVRKGRGLFRRPNRARRPKRMAVHKITRNISIQRIAEIRAEHKYKDWGLEVLNSYYVGEDGQYKYYEVIMYDPYSIQVIKDKNLGKMVWQKGRASRGLTSASKKGRKK